MDEAIVDAYGESEQVCGFYTMLENDLDLPFNTAVLGAEVALGSISLRKSPCIRENCSACESGVGHSSYALAGYRGAQRFSIYVPDELAPDIEKAVENGRQLQELMKEAGVR